MPREEIIAEVSLGLESRRFRQLVSQGTRLRVS
jgi:hypothetical protein